MTQILVMKSHFRIFTSVAQFVYEFLFLQNLVEWCGPSILATNNTD